MVTKHLTDDEVQQYALDKHHCEKRIAEHIHLCEECRTNAEVYQLMITGIKERSQPAFGFDLSEMVLQRIPSSPPETTFVNDKVLAWIFAFMGVAFLGGTIYLFRNYFDLFEGIRTIFIYLIAITAITVLVYLLIDMYKKYRKEMKILDIY